MSPGESVPMLLERALAILGVHSVSWRNVLRCESLTFVHQDFEVRTPLPAE